MDINQESILSVLVGGGGRIKNSELLRTFKEKLNCSDPAEKKQNRDDFKVIINSIAVVKEIEEVKYIVLRKKYLHLLQSGGGGGDGGEQGEGGGEGDEGEGGGEGDEGEGGGGDGGEQGEQGEEGGGGEQVPERPEVPPEENLPEQQCPSEPPLSSAPPSFIEMALQQQKYTDINLKRSLHFKMPLKSGAGDGQKLRPAWSGSTDASAQKRFALPLRTPPPVIITPEEHKETDEMKIPPNDQKGHLAPLSSTPGPPSSPRFKRRSCADSVGVSSSPQPRRHCKSVKPADEPKYSDAVPLDITEHKWMVTSASGHWKQVYGLLLEDVQLADRKDFISGFTALHWAAKCGNHEMLCKIIDLSKEVGKDVDVNTKSFAGYTPLHVAAIHGQMYVIGILVNEYGANPHVRDNSGKKAHHYLVDGTSHSIREMLGGVKVARSEPQKTTEDTDAHKHTHTISRLFQPQTIGYRKKPKSRSTLASLQEDVKDDKPENPKPMHRVLSDVFS